METQQGGKPQKKWYKKIKYWILITLGVFIGIIVLALVSSKGMPILKDVPKEVKQADLEINGWGVEANSMVKAYLNGNLISEIGADENGKFKFSVSLPEGINTVYAEATYKGEVEKSSQKKITYSPEIKVAESEIISEQKEPEQVAPIEKQQPVQQETTETKEQPKEEIENKQEENDTKIITRKEIIALFPEFKFSKGANVDGKENYIAKKDLVVLQLIGSINSLEEVGLMATMSPDVKDITSAIDTKAKYLERIRNKLMPSLTDYDIAFLFHDGDKKQADGFEVTYGYTSLGNGLYVESYTFKFIK